MELVRRLPFLVLGLSALVLHAHLRIRGRGGPAALGRRRSDGGRTFGPARRVSGATFDTRFAAVTFSGFFLGDYQGLAAGRQTFYPVWVATSQTSRIDPPARQSDVFTRAIKP